MLASATTGAHRPVSAGFGDCKHQNAGAHNGYDCPVPSDDGSGGDTGGGGGDTTFAY